MLLAIVPHSVHAQSVISASVTGSVTDETGRALPRVVVTLHALGAGTNQETATGNDGVYRFSLVAPGTYEVRAEAIGYQPLVARTLELGGGDAARVPLSLRPATPPVVLVDTIAVEAATTNRSRPGGVRLAADDIDLLPHRFEDLSSIVGLSSHFDGSLGSQGLPGSMTLLFADGLPVYRARHPLRPEEHVPDAFFPRPFISGVTALHNAPDIEWAGGAGGYGTLATRSGVAGSGVDIEGAWSGGPLWSSSELGLTETPGLTSFQGAGRAAFDIKPDTTQLLVASEVLQHESPLVPRISDGLAADLDGLDSELLVSLAAPSVERVSRYSGLARFYTRPSETSQVFLRGTVAYSERRFDGPGPLAIGGWDALGETSTDFSLASSFLSEYRPGITLEFRGGLSSSSRTFESAVEGLPSAYLVGPGLPLGAVPGAPSESSRTDAVFIPMIRFDLGDAAALKTGFQVRASRHTMRTEVWGAGDFLFADADALLAGRGLLRNASEADATFSTREMGAFAQYDVTAARGLDISLGARFDYERIPSEEPALSTAWLETTGIRNDEYPASYPQFGGRASVTWDPANDGRTRLFAIGSVHSGDVDPARLFEVFSRDGSSETTLYSGTGLDWPEPTVPGTAPRLPTLSLLGPDTRPPRSFRGTAGLVREIAGGLSIHVSGDFRRTDFLLRRRNMNLAQTPSATDQWSRGVFGTLEKDGALVTATGADARRFPSFGTVWALDPDGWSEYRGVTAGLEFRGRSLDLYGSFTRSETTDNWIGAASGSAEAQLSPRLPSFVEPWDEATSDFDVPDRIVASAVVRIPALPETSVGATYRYSSGRPFTPRYRRGVDANGDGSLENDVPFVPQPDELGTLHADWGCLRNQSGGFAVRNSCRGPARQSLDARLRIALGQLGRHNASIFVDGLDLLETKDGLIDDALLLVDPDAGITVTSGATRLNVPYVINPGFGEVLLPTGRGRMIRVGVRIGG
jgi:hypothetical protein